MVCYYRIAESCILFLQSIFILKLLEHLIALSTLLFLYLPYVFFYLSIIIMGNMLVTFTTLLAVELHKNHKQHPNLRATSKCLGFFCLFVFFIKVDGETSFMMKYCSAANMSWPIFLLSGWKEHICLVRTPPHVTSRLSIDSSIKMKIVQQKEPLSLI